MKFTILLLLCFIPCVAQTHRATHTTPAPAQPAHMSDEFCKAALRALFGMNPDTAVAETLQKGLVNDANVEAQSQDELKAVANLQTVLTNAHFNKVMKSLRFDTIRSIWMLNGAKGDLDALYRADPAVVKAFAQDKDCQDALERSLRARMYADLPAVCEAS